MELLIWIYVAVLLQIGPDEQSQLLPPRPDVVGEVTESK